MEKKGYVIQEIGYEYNDEYYYRGDNEGGTPKRVIINRDAAEKKLMEFEIEKWRGESIGYYGEGIEELSNSPDDFEKALEAVGVELDSWSLTIPKTATDEQIKNLIKTSNVRFYEMVEVDVEDEMLPNQEIGPAEELLNLQSPAKIRSIFGSVDDFVSGDIKPIVPPVVEIKEVVMETENNFLAIKDEMKRLRDEARSKVKSFFIKGMDSIFDMYPEVKSVGWNQYTPYFNDGDECTFRCYASSDFCVNGYSEYDDEEDSEDSVNVFEDGEVNNYEWNRDENGRASTKIYKNPEARSVKIYEAISGFLSQLDEEDYRTMFGDHAEITVRKGEITVEEYDHD